MFRTFAAGTFVRILHQAFYCDLCWYVLDYVSNELAADLLERMAALRTCHLRFRELVFVYFYRKILKCILTDLTGSDRYTFLIDLNYGFCLFRIST